MKSKREKNIEYLKHLRVYISDLNKHRMNDIIELYNQNKITNYKTAENAVTLLSSRRKDQQTKANKIYNDIMSKYAPERYEDYQLHIVLYEEPNPEVVRNTKAKLFKKLKQVYTGQITVNQFISLERLKTTIHRSYVINHDNQENIFQHIELKYDDFKRECGSVINLLNKYYHKLLTISTLSLGRNPTEEEARDFFFMEQLIKSDPDVNRLFNDWGGNYIIGIYIKEITPKNLQVAKYDVKTSKKKESAKCSTYYNYISTELDLSQSTLKKALEKIKLY